MPWFRIDDNFDNHPKVLAIPRGAARLRAVGLWTEVGTWCARQLTDGLFPPSMVGEKGGNRADLRWLLEVELWHALGQGCGTDTCPAGVPGQHRMHDYLDWNPSKDRVLAERTAAADRQRRARETAKSRRRHGVTHAEVQPPSRSPRPDPTRPSTAAAAAVGAGPALPPPLEILRNALEARKLHVRWDQLTPEHQAEIEQLITEHGDSALVAQALRDYQPNRPIAFAQGWLPGWRQLRKPGRLELVTADPCTLPGHTGTTARCTQCAAESLGGLKEGHP
jgi:hypothetical protein